LNLWVSIVVGNSYPLTSSPQSAVFWFVAEPGAEPKPSRMAGYFSEIPSNLDLLPDRYFNLPLYKDEIWPHVQASFDFVGFRDEAYFPSGDVNCRPDRSAIPAVNLGHDSDTVAAVTGQLAGALYGQAGIPQRWLEKLACRKQIEDRMAPMLRASKQARKTKAQS
jgi:hypothetical protein